MATVPRVGKHAGLLQSRDRLVTTMTHECRPRRRSASCASWCRSQNKRQHRRGHRRCDFFRSRVERTTHPLSISCQANSVLPGAAGRRARAR